MRKFLIHLFAFATIVLVGCSTSTLEPSATPIPPTNTPTLEPSATHLPPTSSPSSEPTNTPLRPTDTPTSESTPTSERSTNTPTAGVSELVSCEGQDGYCLVLAFDGDSCIYEGPTELVPGLAELVFVNNSEDYAAVNFVVLLDGKTDEDMIEYIGEEPATTHHPTWSRELGTWRPVAPGESQSWKKKLDPGNYSMVCASISALGVWHGTGLIVGE